MDKTKEKETSDQNLEDITAQAELDVDLEVMLTIIDAENVDDEDE